MGWFKRMKDNIATPTVAKKEMIARLNLLVRDLL